MTNWTVKLTGKKTDLFGGTGGNLRDDLDKIASTLGTSKNSLLNQDIIQNIKVKKIIVRWKEVIDSVQFFYQVKANNKQYNVEGYRHGGNGGQEKIIDLGDNEYLLKTWGRSNDWWRNKLHVVHYLEFATYSPNQKLIRNKGECGNSGGKWFQVDTLGCFYARSADWLNSFGIYEAEIIDQSEQKLIEENQSLKSRLKEHQTARENAERERDSLKEKNKTLQADNQRLEADNQRLLADNKHLNEAPDFDEEPQMEAKVLQTDLPSLGRNK